MQELPLRTWLGLGVLVGGQISLALGHSITATWLTPIMWTGLILLVDGLLQRVGGESWLGARRREFPLLLLVSVGVWLVFEAYNLHMVNWVYDGLPERAVVRDFGYFWSFATIMPGIFVVSELIVLGSARIGQARTGRLSVGPSWLWSVVGLAMVTIPLALPPRTAALLFGSVWIGFILLLDPINERLGLTSFRREWSEGRISTTVALLLGGLVCGLLWEAWNQQAARASGAYWVYTIPDQLRPLGLHYGQMPVLGLLGFPPFAMELFLFYALAREIFGGIRVFGARPSLFNSTSYSPGSS